MKYFLFFILFSCSNSNQSISESPIDINQVELLTSSNIEITPNVLNISTSPINSGNITLNYSIKNIGSTLGKLKLSIPYLKNLTITQNSTSCSNSTYQALKAGQSCTLSLIYDTNNSPAGILPYNINVLDLTNGNIKSEQGILNITTTITTPTTTNGCKTNYHLENRQCILNTQSCSSTDLSPIKATAGTKLFNPSTLIYGSCAPTQCLSTYNLLNNTCIATLSQSCSPQPANSTLGTTTSLDNGSTWSSCTNFVCIPTFHLTSGSCISDTQSCSITNGTGSQTWNGTTFGTCTLISCNPNSTNISGSCFLTNQTRTCITQPANSNGGTESTSNGGATWSACTSYTCNTNSTNINGVCVLKQTRTCTTQPTNSTGGTEISNNGGVNWNVCTGFTCSSTSSLVGRRCIDGINYVKQISSPYNSYETNSSISSTSILTDTSNNVYISGYTNGSILGINAGGFSGSNGFIMKNDASGLSLWVKYITSSTNSLDSSSQILSMSKYSTNNLYVTGYTIKQLGTDPQLGYYDMFIAKYDTNGNKLWIKQLGLSSLGHYPQTIGNSIATDSSGNSYVAGSTSTGLILGGLSGNSSSNLDNNNDLLVVKYDTNGNKLWVKQLAALSWTNSSYVLIDSSNNPYVITNASTPTFLGFTKTSTYDMYIIKFTSTGTISSTNRLVGNLFPKGSSIDTLGNIYVTGYIDGFTAFLLKYKISTGLTDWSKSFTSSTAINTSASNTGTGVINDTLGNVYVTGATGGSLFSNPLTGQVDTFVLKYNSSGTLLWSTQLGGYDKTSSSGITIDSSSKVFVTGYTNNLISNTSRLFDLFYFKLY